MLDINNITKSFGSLLVLENLSLQADNGELIRISGPSGAGKTTLLRCIAGLEKFESGSIEMDGKIIQTDKIFKPPHKRRIGMVFQDVALWPHMTVWQNVDFTSSSIIKNKNEREGWNMELLSRFKIDHKRSKYIGGLSGGEQQRVALARALASRPQILLLDEPFSGLDAELSSEIMNRTINYSIDTNILLILVSHADVISCHAGFKSFKMIEHKLIRDL